ncbi:MAG: transposase [Candidatus Micrarchaeota archaeon]
MPIRSWRYRFYPSKTHQEALQRHFQECRHLWNSLLEYAITHYDEIGGFPTREQLYLKAKEARLFSQVAQNVADRLAKSLSGMLAKKRAGRKAGFPRFKSMERLKSFTYPQFGFKLEEKLLLSGIGEVSIKKHREVSGKVKTLTIKRMPSGKWFAIFTTETEWKEPRKKPSPIAGIDLGLEHFAYLSDGAVVANPGNLRGAEERLKLAHRRLSMKKKGSRNRRKAKRKVAISYEKLVNRRQDFLHKTSRMLVESYSFIALENLNVAGLARGFLAKHVLDCSWAEFLSMLAYKAEEAGCEVVLVDPANTSQECSCCGLVQKKSLANRWHSCPCGASMHRDLNAAMNILKRATPGTGGCQACGEDTSTGYKFNWQVSSLKQETHTFKCG